MGLLQDTDDDGSDQRSSDSADRERNHEAENRGGGISHKPESHGIGQESADDPCADHLAQIGQKEPTGIMIDETAQKSAAHAARKGQEASGTQAYPNQTGQKGHDKAVPGPQQDRRQDVDQMLYRKTFRNADGNAEGRSSHRHGDQDAGKNQFEDRLIFHR